jgi:transcription initiation factor TFIIA small subunit
MSQVNEHYRASSIGKALLDTLDELIASGQLAPQLAIRILGRFDVSATEVLSLKAKSKMTAKVLAENAPERQDCAK